MLLRQYTSSDLNTCLSILDSNTPYFFAFSERKEYITFLKSIVDTYYVFEDSNGNIIGCGGIVTLEDGQTSILKWIMIHRECHRRGWGSILVFNCLRLLGNTHLIKRIIVNTSNRTICFYKKLGFQVVTFTPDFYRKGLHRFDMELLVHQRGFIDIEEQLRYRELRKYNGVTRQKFTQDIICSYKASPHREFLYHVMSSPHH